MFKCALIGGKPRAVKYCINSQLGEYGGVLSPTFCTPKQGAITVSIHPVNRSRGDAAETPELNTKMCILPDAGRALRKLPRCRYCSRDAVDSVEGCTWIL